MKQQDDWLKVLGSSLRDTELPPPVGGWERLQRELGETVPAGVKPADATVGAGRPAAPRWKIYGLRVVAVAAVVALGVLVGDWFWRPANLLQSIELPAMVLLADAPAKIEAAADASVISDAQSLLAQNAQPMQSVRYAQRVPKTVQSVSTTAVQQEAAAISMTPVQPESAVQTSAKISTESSTEERSATVPETTPQRTSSSSRAATRSTRTVYPDQLAYAPEAKHRATSFGLFGGGSVTGGNSTGPTGPSFLNDPSHVVGSDVQVQRRDDYPKSSFRHHQPLSFGLSVRKELPYGLSLESGVNYTLLRSDVRKPFASQDMSQKLHFIGVPLRLNWQCYERGRFSIYIGAGGMIEKCVSAKLGSESVDEQGVQWSLQGVAGAQYRLGNLVGLYFEPEASYYLTETTLRTARTEAPLSLTLRLGVRLSF